MKGNKHANISPNFSTKRIQKYFTVSDNIRKAKKRKKKDQWRCENFKIMQKYSRLWHFEDCTFLTVQLLFDFSSLLLMEKCVNKSE